MDLALTDIAASPSRGGLPSHRITVLAVGNPILHDDGAGQAILAALQGQPADTWMPRSAATAPHLPTAEGGLLPDKPQEALPPGVRCVDGGISGMELIPLIEDCTHLLLLDAIAGAHPGELVVLDGDQLPRLREASLSPHQVGLLDVLSSARLLGVEPQKIAAVGIVPKRVDPGVGLSSCVAARVSEAANQARQIVWEWADEWG